MTKLPQNVQIDTKYFFWKNENVKTLLEIQKTNMWPENSPPVKSNPIIVKMTLKIQKRPTKKCYRCPPPNFFSRFSTPHTPIFFMIFAQIHVLYDDRASMSLCVSCSFAWHQREAQIFFVKSCIFQDLGKNK